MNKDNQQPKITNVDVPEKVQQVFDCATKMSLTIEEKTLGINAIKTFTEQHQTFNKTPILSPYNTFFRVFSYIKKPQFVSVTVAIVLIFSVTTTGVYAAKNSIPGDLLYPIKTNVIEKTENILAIRTQDKAKIAVKHAITRLEELEKLVTKNKLNTQNEQAVNQRLDAQAEIVRKNIIELNSEGNLNLAIDISSDFESSLQDHEKKLGEISKDLSKNTEAVNKLRESIREQITQSKEQRQKFESMLTASSSIIEIKKTALDELDSSQEKIKQTEIKIKKIPSIITSTSTKNIIEIQKDIDTAKQKVEEGKEKIDVGAYKKATTLFKDASEHAEKVERKLEDINNSQSDNRKQESNIDVKTEVKILKLD